MTVLPDVAAGKEGVGFTCTGLTRGDGFWYVGNYGLLLQSDDDEPRPSIVKLTEDFTENIGEIDLHKNFGPVQIQGLTVDASDNTIWFCSFAENKVRHITENGDDLFSLDIEEPTGITYDSRTDTLWVLTYTMLKNISKNGDIILEIPIVYDGQDQLYLDELSNKIYFTAGLDYNGDSYIYVVDLSSLKVFKFCTLKDSYAIEGLWIENDILYVLNDGYYHNAKIPVNQINEYDLSTLEK